MNVKNIFDFFLIKNIPKFIRESLVLLKNIFNFFRRDFKKITIRQNSVLIIEFASFHGENFPSLTKYLLDLGYNVDIIFRKVKNKGKSRNELGLFSCFTGDSRVRVKILSGMDMNLLLRSSIVAIYKHIIIVTFNNRMKRNHFYKIDFFKLKPICMMHNSDNSSNNYFQTSKIISPVKIDCINRKSPPYVVSIHYFGNFPKKHKSKKTTFVTLNTTDLFRRNLHLLFSACDKLYMKKITNFSVKIIGDGLIIPKRFHDNFQVFGFLDFQKMCEEIVESDFFLALIDQASVEYTNKASGSYGLSYGFLKPIVLHRKFSIVSDFDDENSILYNNNDDLSDAMERCINMSSNDYSTLVCALEISSKKLYNASMNNLKEVLETPIRCVSTDELLEHE